MRKLTLLPLMLVAIVSVSSCDDAIEERPIVKDFDVDTLLVYEMVSRAKAAGPTLQQFADSIALLHAGKVCPVNYKSEESTIRKCWTDSCQADELRDLVRLTIACPFDSLRPLITDLANTAKRKNIFNRYKHQEMLDRGYWGDIVNLQHDGPLVSEIQVKSFFMTYATYEGDMNDLLGDSIISSIYSTTGAEPAYSHHYYEIIRDITGKYSEAEKEQAAKDSYDYMLSFWEGYKPGMTFYDE